MSPDSRFFAYVYDAVRAVMDGWVGRAPDDIYVVSFYVCDDEDDPRRPTLTVGFNTETQVAAETGGASDEREARWNYAFWLQNEECVIGSSHSVQWKASVRHRDQWVTATGLGYTDAEEDADLDAALDRGAQITARFVEGCVAVARRLHADGVIRRVFGKPIPIVVHELEYYDAIADQTERANPPGVADAFCTWVRQ